MIGKNSTVKAIHERALGAIRRTAITLVCTALAGAATASAGEVHPMRFDRLTLDDGLSQSSVISIHQDAEGYMWFGTENGLNRYNGYDFEHFRQQRGRDDALRNDFVYAIADARDGGLWLATNGGGLALLDNNRQKVQSYVADAEDSTSIAGNVIRTLLVDADGMLWLGFRNDGLDRFDPQTGEVTHIELGQSASVFALFQSADGLIWAGADEGLFRVDPNDLDVQHYRHDAADPASLSSNRVRAVYEDGAGNLWVGTRSAGLNRLDRERGTFEHFRHDPATGVSISSDRVTVIFEDADHRLWVGTADGLNLMQVNSGRFLRFHSDASDPNSLGTDAVAALYQDKAGILWVGTLTGGVSKWNPRTWGLGLQDSRTLAADTTSQPNVTGFATDSAGNVWIGTFGDGLIARDRQSGEVRFLRHDAADPNSISDDRVMSLLVSSDQSLWIGTMTGGLNRIDLATGSNTIYRHDPVDLSSLGADGIMAVFEDRHGRVWVGTFGGGVSVYEPKSNAFVRYDTDNSGLHSNRVTSFAEDHAGNIWIGTDAGGLSVFNPLSEAIRSFRFDAENPASLAADTVYSLHVDANGQVWAGTRGGGLDRVRVSESGDVLFSNFSQADGLANDVIYGIQSDANGALWLSTNYGISRFDPETREVRNLHRRDGLQSEEFNFGAHHRSADGELFFGGHQGYNAFHPDRLESNDVVPPVVLSDFFNSNDPTKADLPDGDIEVSYQADTVSFEFAALDYSAPQSNRYMYKLEGFDKDWIDLGSRRRVTYTDLDDGAYILRVKAANSDGVWNESGIALPIRVTPAPWDTWWAYLGYVAMAVQLVVFLWLGHQRKLRREEEYSRRLEREVRARTAELAERNVELRDLNLSLQESSLSDPLTGLRNRRFVFEEVPRQIETIGRKYENERRGLDAKNASDLVFMMVDLDNFKPVNDTYGHAAGDQMLLDIRDVLLDTCRRSDFVIRWGGDEFVVIAKQSHPQESEALAERIRQEIGSREFVLPEGQIVRTTCSIGFTAFPLYKGQAETGSLDEVIAVADSLMYEAKRKRNAWVGMHSLNEAVTSEGFGDEPVETSSMLFRARRAGRVVEHQPEGLAQISSAG